MMVETPLARADLCILFGNAGQPPVKPPGVGKAHIERLAEHAAELYHKGYFDLIIVTGGVATDNGRLEAHRMREVLAAQGVPEKKIIVEDKAQSTVQNVIYSMALLEEKVGISNIRSLVGIGHIHASRRFLMTLQRHWAEVTKMFTAPNCFDASKDQWHTDPEFRKAVLREYETTIPEQMAKDFIREVDMDKFHREIALLKPPSPRL